MFGGLFSKVFALFFVMYYSIYIGDAKLIEWYQVSSDLPNPILSQPNPTPKYINNVWFQDFIRFMSNNDIKIITKDVFYNHPQQKNDKCIMKEIMKQKFTNTQMTQKNKSNLVKTNFVDN